MPLKDQNQRLRSMIEQNSRALEKMHELLAGLRAETRVKPVAQPEQNTVPGAIVIVDDSPLDLILTKRTIQRLKLNNPLHELSTGRALLSYLKGEGIYHDRQRYPYPILLLLDLRMPGIDGFDVLAWLKEHPEHASFPIVVLSGSDELREVNRAYLLGAQSFLSKPVTEKDFSGVVSKMDSISGPAR